jgi:UDP-2-acetamido-2,6-beta-L-arabino-hexul-4-ose reductase
MVRMIKLRILVTGPNGFIGKNLLAFLREMPEIEVLTFIRGDNLNNLKEFVKKVDAIIHLAGENRPIDQANFSLVNIEFTRAICDAISASNRNITLIFTSSIQADFDSLYGKSKLAAEEIIKNYAMKTNNPTIIYRLPGVFGKWCKPNYNSVVATYCHNIARDIPIKIDNPSTRLKLVFIDDVIKSILQTLDCVREGLTWMEIQEEYSITLSELAAQIYAFKNSRINLTLECVGTGLVRALYSTYMTYLPSDQFTYNLPLHIDERGIFVEMLKTKNSGQIAFFTIHPGITRGSHYHHAKTEKFLVVKGIARMRFRHILTDETHELNLSAEKPEIAESIPGWAHEITNIGDNEAIVMLWANEIFDQKNPDCIPIEV